MSTTVQLRIDSKVKVEAQKVLKKMGLDLSSAIKMFLSQVVNTRKIPFQILTENGYTSAEERRMIKETEWAKKHSKRYTSAKEAMDDILR
jgi:DNA-damage-inducible protein J